MQYTCTILLRRWTSASRNIHSLPSKFLKLHSMNLFNVYNKFLHTNIATDNDAKCLHRRLNSIWLWNVSLRYHRSACYRWMITASYSNDAPVCLAPSVVRFKCVVLGRRARSPRKVHGHALSSRAHIIDIHTRRSVSQVPLAFKPTTKVIHLHTSLVQTILFPRFWIGGKSMAVLSTCTTFLVILRRRDKKGAG